MGTRRLRILKYIKYGIFFSSLLTVLAIAVDQFVFSRYAYLASCNIIRPQQYAQELFDRGQYRDAQEYIDFYSSIPGVTRTPQLEEIYAKAEEARSSLKYMAEELAEGFIFGESQEDYGRWAGFTSEMLVIGDVRDLSKAGYHWYQDGELDEFEQFIAAISAVNIGIALVSIGPQAPAGVMAKTGTSVVKVAYRTKNLSKSFVRNLIDVAGNKALVNTVVEPLADLGRFAKEKGITPAMSVLSRTKSLDDLPRVIKTAGSLGDDTVSVFKYGGQNVVPLVERFGAPTVKRFAVYGEDAVNLLNRVPAAKLMDDILVVIKRSGDVFYTTLKSVLNIAVWLFPVLLGFLSLIFGLIKKGVLMGVEAVTAVAAQQKDAVQQPEQKDCDQK